MLRIVFMGTPDFSVPTLAAITDAGHHLAAVYSQPPRPAGRGMHEQKSPVHRFAEAAGIPVVEHMTGLEALPPRGFRFHAAPPKIAGVGTFPVRAYAIVTEE